MTQPAVIRSFDVAVPCEQAWRLLALVERWPEWAPHITAVHVSPAGPLGASSVGTIAVRGFGRTTFRMSVWVPPERWEWTSTVPGVQITYDHRFTARDGTTTMTWTVALDGALAPLIRPVFARIYGRNLDRAIPRLQRWMAAGPATRGDPGPSVRRASTAAPEATVGQPAHLHDPFSGQHITFARTGEETAGELLEAEVRLDPGGSVPLHVHLRQDERVDVIEGNVSVRVAGRRTALGPGDHAEVRRRQPHVVRNDGPGPATFRLQVRPARRMEQAMRALFGMLGALGRIVGRTGR